VYKFNLGCIFERECNFKEASALFKEVIQRQPYYIDAYLRLAHLAMRNNDESRALNYASLAKSKLRNVSESNIMCVIGTIHLRSGDIKKAYTTFE
jgi:hypothetical protein